MATHQNTPRAKEVVQARVDPAALAKLDAMAVRQSRSRSELIDFATQEYVIRHTAKGKDRKPGRPPKK